MSTTVTEAYQVASRALIEKTGDLSDVGTTLPLHGSGQKRFRYSRDLLGWVLESPGLDDTDRAGLCFDALCLLGIAHAVPETFAWSDARRAWEKEYAEFQKAIHMEGV